ncbi:unnamed product [Ostreococcus tauri]|uniref:Unnamed product n=1 Tax=Ostreococcus tauri TaxID=70448 RepID=A0A090M631_OSTTA|nr:unnamed product [Ostreococcus tauri]OUS47786.1 hypothetical protein BE221DRAFT_190098 [Ostreococcus tauri]CEF98132.1 unnamed product [Ostreococcus tauri]|eukprot:XP_003079547.2 unnamed product [Ostreococcus tauri]
MRAPRPLKGGLFANPELVYHDESGRKANLLTHEFGEDIAAKLGTRAAFHQTCVCRLDAKGDDGEDAWIEVDIAGPALDNYEFSPGGVPLCCAPVSAAEREGWTSTVEELVDACSEDELALARDFADRAYAFLQS